MLWISVDDRLPESFAPRPCLVLCRRADYRGGPHCVVAEHEGNNQWARDDGDVLEFEVSHWMPLPEPPTKEMVR